MADHGKGGRIVVGVDGSQSSKQALRWAVDQAACTSSSVEAIITWGFPPMYGWAPPASEFSFQANARSVLAETVTDVLGPTPPVPVRERVEEGNAAQLLIDASRGAQLLVVGSRGRGGFAGALLGSVSQHCVAHAACPVVVIREETD